MPWVPCAFGNVLFLLCSNLLFSLNIVLLSDLLPHLPPLSCHSPLPPFERPSSYFANNCFISHLQINAQLPWNNLISTEGALRLPTSCDNHPSNPIHPISTYSIEDDLSGAVLSISFDLLNSIICDLKRSADLRPLFDLVLHSSLDDFVLYSNKLTSHRVTGRSMSSLSGGWQCLWEVWPLWKGGKRVAAASDADPFLQLADYFQGQGRDGPGVQLQNLNIIIWVRNYFLRNSLKCSSR